MYKYLLERIRDGRDCKKGMRIWTDAPCTGWRVISEALIPVSQTVNYAQKDLWTDQYINGRESTHSIN